MWRGCLLKGIHNHSPQRQSSPHGTARGRQEEERGRPPAIHLPTHTPKAFHMWASANQKPDLFLIYLDRTGLLSLKSQTTGNLAHWLSQAIQQVHLYVNSLKIQGKKENTQNQNKANKHSWSSTHKLSFLKCEPQETLLTMLTEHWWVCHSLEIREDRAGDLCTTYTCRLNPSPADAYEQL